MSSPATSAAAATTIPNEACFVWDDHFLPYGAVLALKSAARNGGFSRIHLLKTPALDGVPNYERLRREIPALEPVNIELESWLEEAGLSCRHELLAAHRFLQERRFYWGVSDLLRSLWLYLRGGIYLDTDTLTLKPFAPLLPETGFLAEEHILVSSRVFKRNSRWRYFKTGPLTLFRNVCARLSFGVSLFRLLEPLYVRATHNAIMGFGRRHPLMKDLLERIAEKYPDAPKRYPLLGPDALQDLQDERTYEGVSVFPPRYFSPLGPTMTYQYFHLRAPHVVARLRRSALCADTTSVHWSNNGTIAKVAPRCDEDVRRLAPQQLFSRLALEAALGEDLGQAVRS